MDCFTVLLSITVKYSKVHAYVLIKNKLTGEETKQN